MKKTLLSASILSANFAALGEDCKQVLKAGCDQIHFDVMDHHYVPNLSFGAVVCDSLRKAGITAEIDVHLMVSNPERHFSAFAKAGASCITFHPETVDDVPAALMQVREHNMQVGLAVNPDQSLDLLTPYISQIDLVLLMSVYPGFGGQAFIPESLERIATLREEIDKQNEAARLAVDGGVKIDNIAEIVQAGADFCVMGSGIFAASNYKKQLQAIREAISVTCD